MRVVGALVFAALVLYVESKPANSTGTLHGDDNVAVSSTPSSSVSSASTSSSLASSTSSSASSTSSSASSTTSATSPSSSPAQSTSRAAASDSPITSIPWQTTGSDLPIKGALSTYCFPPSSPCTVACASDDDTCLSDASLAIAVCKPQWTAYQNASATWALRKYGNGSYTLTRTATDYVVSTLFPSYSTDLTEAFSNLYASAATYHPVYAFGSGVPSTVSAEYFTFTNKYALTDVRTLGTSVTVETYRDTVTTITQVDFVPVTAAGFPEQPPACSVTYVQPVECQQCQISGGTVELYFWPPEDSGTNSTHPNSTITQPPTEAQTTVVGGITMISPSVYISLNTVYASDGCRQVGANHTQTVLAMDPDKVSTLFGARGAGYIPVDSAQIDYHDLVGAVPASQYERNPACARFGCVTLRNEYYRPILSIPPEIRNLDPAWAGCRLDLGGLYDPPVALQSVASIAQPTVPGGVPSPGPTAEPGTSPVDPAPQPTTTSAPGGQDQSNIPALPQQSPCSPQQADPPSQPNATPSASQPTPQQNASSPAGSNPAPQPQDPAQQEPSDSLSPAASSQSQTQTYPQPQADPRPGVNTPASASSESSPDASIRVSGMPSGPTSQTPAAGGSPGQGSIIASIIGITAPDRTSTGQDPSPTTAARGSQTPSTVVSGSPSTISTAETTNIAWAGKNVPLIALLLGLSVPLLLAL